MHELIDDVKVIRTPSESDAHFGMKEFFVRKLVSRRDRGDPIWEIETEKEIGRWPDRYRDPRTADISFRFMDEHRVNIEVVVTKKEGETVADKNRLYSLSGMHPMWIFRKGYQTEVPHIRNETAFYISSGGSEVLCHLGEVLYWDPESGITYARRYRPGRLLNPHTGLYEWAGIVDLEPGNVGRMVQDYRIELYEAERGYFRFATFV